MRKNLMGIVAALAGTLLATGVAHASDTLKLAVGQRGIWQNAAPELGQKAGIFGKHGLELEILYTSGGGETLQAVLSNSVDVGIGVGTSGALGAFTKGAPVRLIGNSMTGGNDNYWYVRSDSPIMSMADTGDKTVAFSTIGSSTNAAVLGLIKEAGVTAKPVATGNPSATFTQVMSGQIDVGWSAPPFGVEALQQGKIRIIARASDLPSLREQTVRLNVTSASTLDQKADALKRFVEAYQETLDWMYADPKALQAYADFAGVPLKVAQHTRDDFYPKDTVRMNRLSGMKSAMQSAIELKFIKQPLTTKQMKELVQYPDGYTP